MDASRYSAPTPYSYANTDLDADTDIDANADLFSNTNPDADADDNAGPDCNPDTPANCYATSTDDFSMPDLFACNDALFAIADAYAVSITIGVAMNYWLAHGQGRLYRADMRLGKRNLRSL